VIKESLRLYTSNCPPMERLAPKGFSVNQIVVPEGTVVAVPQYVAHRAVEVYGQDAETFRPERWLEADSITARVMERNFLAVSLHSPFQGAFD